MANIEDSRSGDRVLRTKIDGPPITQDATVRLHDNPRAIAAPDTSAMVGLEGLQKSLSRFFGMVGSVSETAMKADFAVQKLQAIDDNKKRADEAEADVALLPGSKDGKPLTPDQLPAEKTGYKAYADAASKALGIRNGQDLWSSFHQEMLTKPILETDFAKSKEEFLKRELQNGMKMGTGNPILDAHMLHSFNQKADAFGETYGREQFKARTIKGENDRLAGFAQQFDDPTFGAKNIADAISDIQKLNPLEPSKAPGKVMSALVAAAGSNPDKIHKVLAMVSQPGSGIGGGVLSKQAPEAAMELSDKLTQAYTSQKSMEGLGTYDNVRKLVQGTNDIGQLTTMYGWADEIRNRYGEQGQYRGLQEQIHSKLQQAQKQELKFTALDGMSKGANLDASLVRSDQWKYMQRLGIDVWKQPEDAAQVIVAHRGVIDTDLKTEVESALTQYNDPVRTAAALRMVKGVIGGLDGNPESAKQILGSEAYIAFRDADRQMTYNRTDPVAMATWLQANKSVLQSDVKLGHFLGTPDDKAEKSVQDEIESGLKAGWFSSGNTVHVDPAVLKDVSELTRQTLLNRSRGGTTPDWKLAVSDVVSAVKDNLPAFPGADGTLMIAPTLMPKEVPQIDPAGKPVFDEKGRPKTTQLVPFGNSVPNPNNAMVPEDTIATFRKDMGDLFSKPVAGGVVGTEGGPVEVPDVDKTTIDPNKWSVTGNSRLAQKGLWMVEDDKHQPVVLAKGHSYTIAGTKITIPDDDEEAHYQLGQIKTPGDGRIALVPYPWGYAVGYRPGFTQKLPTIADREKAYKAPPKADPMAAVHPSNRNPDDFTGAPAAPETAPEIPTD